MSIEKIRITTTIKAGSIAWAEGTVIIATKDEPIHPALLGEIESNTGTVEVLSEMREPPLSPVKEIKKKQISIEEAKEELPAEVKAKEEPLSEKTDEQSSTETGSGGETPTVLRRKRKIK
jgi:hypothetical protein